MMKPTLFLIAFSALMSNITALSGSGPISTHPYQEQRSILETSQVACGIPASQMNLDRVTAVQGLDKSQCGTCLKVTSKQNGLVLYIVAVDIGGQGLDMNTVAFSQLSDGETTGHVDVTWESTDAGKCAGVITSGDAELPGMRTEPGAETSESKPEKPVKSEDEDGNGFEEEEEEEESPKSQKSHKPSHTPKDIPKGTSKDASYDKPTDECGAGIYKKCISDKQYVSCVHKQRFIESCNPALTCKNAGDAIQCV